MGGINGKRTRRTTRTVGAEVRWRGIVADHRTSGKSLDEFCSERGINKIMFYKWRKRFRIEDAERGVSEEKDAARPAAKLVPVRVTSSSSATWSIEVTFPAGHVLRAGQGVDAGVITAILATMRAVAC